jgi:hypothetical protein
MYYYQSRPDANSTLDPKNIRGPEKYTELWKIYGALKNTQIPPPAFTTNCALRNPRYGNGNGLWRPAAESVYFWELRIFFRAPYLFQSSVYFSGPEWISHSWTRLIIYIHFFWRLAFLVGDRCKATAVVNEVLKIPKMKPNCARKWFRHRFE